ncbi:Bax inhibitor-1/YccA family protein [Aestuariimicrobium ganziense]|uniref:Bax inhibitor-1/YccA family protein n=1 Tax=Aestuariimicrobium ganziense TaxID=2773677 RepID=UPI00194098E4|nr:Bax inhibitor-1/YccA family protein [Aestuariimicrobium ganziense]
MANPILSQSETFNSARPQANPYQGYGQAQYRQAQYQQAPQGWGQPQQQWQQDQQIPQWQQQMPQSQQGVMTMDDVLVKTGLSLGVVALTAVLGAAFLPTNLLLVGSLVAAFAAMAMSFVLARKRTVPAAGVIAFAAVEGVFVGGISAFLEGMFPGIVATAVIATFAAAAATLAAYKFFNIRVTPKFRKITTIGLISFVVLILVNLGLSFAGIDLGIRDIGGGASMISIIISIIAVGLAIMSLISDFDMVERGLANRAPATESWRAALGITATMVFLYVELLRIASYFRD